MIQKFNFILVGYRIFTSSQSVFDGLNISSPVMLNGLQIGLVRDVYFTPDRSGNVYVKLAIDELPDDFKMVIVLSFLEGFSYQEIADITDLQIGTVKSTPRSFE